MISDLLKEINGFAMSHQQLLLDLERARMTAEDLRVASISPYPNNLFIYPPRHLTWREFAEERMRSYDAAAPPTPPGLQVLYPQNVD